MTTYKNQQQAITNLQKYLRTVMAREGEVLNIPIDGIYDTATRQALTDFQKNAGIVPTGIADKLTWDTLFSQYQKNLEQNRRQEGLFLFPDNPKNYEIGEGDTLLLVRIIQLLLIELQRTYDIFEEIVENGTYDIATQNAIREFQRINLLPQTGKVDRVTWNRIVSEYSNLDNIQE